jgi:predicted RNase H-like nuclease (RuvC/YqgF family)
MINALESTLISMAAQEDGSGNNEAIAILENRCRELQTLLYEQKQRENIEKATEWEIAALKRTLEDSERRCHQFETDVLTLQQTETARWPQGAHNSRLSEVQCRQTKSFTQ